MMTHKNLPCASGHCALIRTSVRSVERASRVPVLNHTRGE